VVIGDWSDFAHRADAANWREALVGAVTYADAEQFPAICTALGDRLSNAAGSSSRLLHSALLCYICAGDLDNVVQCWLRIKNTDDGPKVSHLEYFSRAHFSFT
jgi:protein transport protein SEC31